jgi:hypothetical protein
LIYKGNNLVIVLDGYTLNNVLQLFVAEWRQAAFAGLQMRQALFRKPVTYWN